MSGLWNDPFRLVLVISLVALAAWVVALSGVQAETSSRTRTGDVDAAESASILVSVDDDSPFDVPFDEVVVAPDPGATDAATAPREDAERGGEAERGSGGATGTTRQPSTDGGSTTRPPVDTGGTDTDGSPTTGGTDTGATGTGTGTGAGAPIVDPGTTGTPGTPVAPVIPGVEVPLPAVPAPAGTTVAEVPLLG